MHACAQRCPRRAASRCVTAAFGPARRRLSERLRCGDTSSRTASRASSCRNTKPSLVARSIPRSTHSSIAGSATSVHGSTSQVSMPPGESDARSSVASSAEYVLANQHPRIPAQALQQQREQRMTRAGIVEQRLVVPVQRDVPPRSEWARGEKRIACTRTASTSASSDARKRSTSVLLPIPASPATRATAPRPARACINAACNAASACSRSRNALTRRLWRKKDATRGGRVFA